MFLIKYCTSSSHLGNDNTANSRLTEKDKVKDKVERGVQGPQSDTCGYLLTSH